MFSTLREDIASVIERDPSVHSAADVIFWHTGMHAVWAYRRAHWLCLPRLPTHAQALRGGDSPGGPDRP